MKSAKSAHPGIEEEELVQTADEFHRPSKPQDLQEEQTAISNCYYEHHKQQLGAIQIFREKLNENHG